MTRLVRDVWPYLSPMACSCSATLRGGSRLRSCDAISANTAAALHDATKHTSFEVT